MRDMNPGILLEGSMPNPFSQHNLLFIQTFILFYTDSVDLLTCPSKRSHKTNKCETKLQNTN